MKVLQWIYCQKLMWCEVWGGIKYVLSCSSKLSIWSFILKVLVANYEVSCEFVDRCNNYIIVVGED